MGSEEFVDKRWCWGETFHVPRPRLSSRAARRRMERGRSPTHTYSFRTQEGRFRAAFETTAGWPDLSVIPRETGPLRGEPRLYVRVLALRRRWMLRSPRHCLA
jgi:hypothetical protein